MGNSGKLKTKQNKTKQNKKTKKQKKNTFNPRPPEPFSVTRPPRGLVATPSGFSMMNVPYPYVCYQCIAMSLLFPLMPKQNKYHPSTYDVTMTS